MKKSLMISLSFLMMLLMGIGNAAKAAEYPAKPITCIVPMEAGADQDIVGRKMIEKVNTALSKPIIIVNKPGAGQTIGYRETYQAKPDGYTICFAAGSIALTKMLGLFPYDHHDFTVIAFVFYTHPILVASTKTQRPFTTFDEVVTFAKANPNKVKLATSAAGGALWVTTQLILEGTNLKLNVIPQEGSAGLVISQVVGGHTDLGTTFFPAAKPQIEAGNMRFLAVVGPQHFPGKYNDVKTMKDFGYDISMSSFGVILGPPKIPKEIVQKLTKAFEVGCNDPEVKQFHLERNYFIDFMPPDRTIAFIDKEQAVYRRVLDKAGLLKGK
jgi:tripartite-type tricarboxylate transporter receptor subunit TctC